MKVDVNPENCCEAGPGVITTSELESMYGTPGTKQLLCNFPFKNISIDFCSILIIREFHVWIGILYTLHVWVSLDDVSVS